MPGRCLPGGELLGDVSAVPQTSSRMPAAPAAVLSVAGGSGRGARPGMRAVGGDPKMPSGSLARPSSHVV